MKPHILLRAPILTLFLSGLVLIWVTNSTMANQEEPSTTAKTEHNADTIVLNAEQISHAEIVLRKVQAGTIHQVLPVYGTVKVNAELTQSVSARFNGLIKRLTKKIGDRVSKGETLLLIEANSSLQTYPVRASRSGFITERIANVGEQTAGRTLMVIQDFSTVWVDVSVFPKDIFKVNIGQTVRVRNKSAGMSANGTVIYIAPYSNAINQAILVRLLLNNPHRIWTPGQFVSALISITNISAPMVVNNEAIQIIANKNIVFIKSKNGFKPQPVTLGESDGKFTQVLGGLKKNEFYVSNNSFVLKSELGKEDAENGD